MRSIFVMPSSDLAGAAMRRVPIHLEIKASECVIYSCLWDKDIWGIRMLFEENNNMKNISKGR